MVSLPIEHFRGSVARRATGGLQSLILLVGVGKTKINNAQILPII